LACKLLLRFLFNVHAAFYRLIDGEARVAATSSLQLRAISNFGTPSATGITSCELNMILEIEIGISGPLLVSTASRAGVKLRSMSIGTPRFSSMRKRIGGH
jgi:hypothetical protein